CDLRNARVDFSEMTATVVAVATDQLRHDRVENLMTQLAARMGNRSYLSTQEQMALLLAARAAGGDKSTPWQAALTVNGVRKELEGGRS
ncbi:hypothetical protein, partial [Paraburkholderia sp. SIMBA_027]|uniref:hypothetical protein n=1 Tax=Paraburkholderia sp. SIMBA_027 TaxID=3085770 RepID=UPI00397B14E6